MSITGLAGIFKALSTTKYEIVNTEAISNEDIIVPVSIQGIDDEKACADTEDQQYNSFMEEDIVEDEIISKNMEILIQNYHDVDSFLDAVEVNVDVIRDRDGSYLVMLQEVGLSNNSKNI